MLQVLKYRRSNHDPDKHQTIGRTMVGHHPMAKGFI